MPCTCRSTRENCTISISLCLHYHEPHTKYWHNPTEHNCTNLPPNAVPGTVARDAFRAIVFRTALLVDDRTVTPRQRLAAVQAVAFLFAFVYQFTVRAQIIRRHVFPTVVVLFVQPIKHRDRLVVVRVVGGTKRGDW